MVRKEESWAGEVVFGFRRGDAKIVGRSERGCERGQNCAPPTKDYKRAKLCTTHERL
jgi:hypothetical protein